VGNRVGFPRTLGGCKLSFSNKPSDPIFFSRSLLSDLNSHRRDITGTCRTGFASRPFGPGPSANRRTADKFTLIRWDTGVSVRAENFPQRRGAPSRRGNRNVDPITAADAPPIVTIRIPPIAVRKVLSELDDSRDALPKDTELEASEMPGTATLLRHAVIDSAKCVVVKVGTRVLTTPDGKLDIQRVEALSAQLCRIADTGRQVIMVSSGAVGAGVAKLDLPSRPKDVGQLQAVAAIGQTDLIRTYEKALAKHGRHAAQVLLTKSDLRRRSGYLHVRNAINSIHALGAIAIVNENDSVAVQELRTTFGDNDRLAAHVAGLMEDVLLVILSDIEGLYDGPPEHAESERIDMVRSLNDRVLELADDKTSAVSKGGMRSKLKAAQIATSHGHATIIGPGRLNDVLDRVIAGDEIGTLFLPKSKSIRGRRRWIGSTAKISGSLVIDAGAAKAITEQGRSLLAIGIRETNGSFARGSVVAILDTDGHSIGRGLCNYRSSEVVRIAGHNSESIAEILGSRPYDSVIHRDNLVVDVVED